MKTYLSRIIICNRAPFSKLNLSLNENGISVLTGVNGKGKTTILSYIVDSWFEIIRNHYTNEFKGQEQTYYRVSTSMFVPDSTLPSVVYIRYQIGDNIVDYLNTESELTEAQYNELINLQGKIPFKKIMGKENLSQKGKFVSESANEKLVMNPYLPQKFVYFIENFQKNGFSFVFLEKLHYLWPRLLLVMLHLDTIFHEVCGNHIFLSDIPIIKWGVP